MKKLLIAIIVVVLFSSVLVGCTNRDNNNVTPTGTAKPVTPTATATVMASPTVSPAMTTQPTMTASPMVSPNITGDELPGATVSPAGSPKTNQ